VFLFIGCVVVSVAAIFLGPVFGVGVLLEWLEERDRNRRKKREEKIVGLTASMRVSQVPRRRGDVSR